MIPTERNKRLAAAATCSLLAIGATTVIGDATPSYGAVPTSAIRAPRPSPDPRADPPPVATVPQLWGDPAQTDRASHLFRAQVLTAPWRVTPSLENMLAEFNALAPDRDRSSDGSIGDTSHSGRPSGHNPDETGVPEDIDSDHRNEVRARDFDVDLNLRGVTMEMVARYLVQECRAGRITWIKYIIFDRRLWAASGGWATRAYTGANPHDKHMHVSSKADTASENDTGPLGLVSTLRREIGGAIDRLAVDRLAGATRMSSTFYSRGRVTAGWSTSTPSTFIDHFDVLVDGRTVARVPGGRRTAVLRLGPGRHTVQVRAVHLSGRATLTRAKVLIADREPPAFTRKPVVTLRPGSLRSTVPVSLGWQASDPGGVRAVTLATPVQTRFDAARTGWVTGARPDTATTWALRATDRAGNVTHETVTRTPVVTRETAAESSGAWSPARDPAYLSGAALRSTQPGAALSWTFRGRAAAVVFSRSARAGRAIVSVDGRRAATVDLRAATTAHRQVAWTANLRGGGTHTVTVTVEGTAGRPGVVVDGFVHLR